MLILRVPDIGDGLSGAIYTRQGVSIQIDCGSQQSAREAFENGMSRTKPDFFILSHFHSDHYNGLFEGIRTKERFPIEQAIMPVIPQFTEREKFVHCLFAMNARILGGSSGSMDYDFLSVMNQLSKHQISYRRVKKGDEVVLGDTHIQILWPPQVLNDDEILGSVKKALGKFDEAIKQDDILKKIYDSLDEKGVLKPYLSENEAVKLGDSVSSDLQSSPMKRYSIPDVTEEANKALRSVANRLSLGFRVDSQLLFLGDLESNEINSVVDDLEAEQRLRFPIMLTPHHGTHWGNRMRNLSIGVAVSSVGKKLFGKVKPDYKDIVDHHLLTHVEGEVVLPTYFGLLRKNMPWWYFL